MIVLKMLGSYLPGFGSLELSILLLGGIQLISIGIIGEYVGRIYDEVKGRPLYLVRARTTRCRRRRSGGARARRSGCAETPSRALGAVPRTGAGQPPAGLGPTGRSHVAPACRAG